jgi:hypothetical protein
VGPWNSDLIEKSGDAVDHLFSRHIHGG